MVKISRVIVKEKIQEPTKERKTYILYMRRLVRKERTLNWVSEPLY